MKRKSQRPQRNHVKERGRVGVLYLPEITSSSEPNLGLPRLRTSPAVVGLISVHETRYFNRVVLDSGHH